jgi:hypothetical protein
MNMYEYICVYICFFEEKGLCVYSNHPLCTLCSFSWGPSGELYMHRCIWIYMWVFIYMCIWIFVWIWIYASLKKEDSSSISTTFSVPSLGDPTVSYTCIDVYGYICGYLYICVYVYMNMNICFFEERRFFIYFDHPLCSFSWRPNGDLYTPT